VSRHTARGRIAVLALIALLSVTAACGGDGDSDDGGGTTDTSAGAGTNVTLAADGPPQSGGTLRYGLNGETDGWNPSVNRWAGDGTQVGLSIFDPLAAYAADGSIAPYLAESFESNADFTEWTITLRPNITFHNGEPLTSTAVQRTMDGLRTSALTAPALRPISSIETPDDLTVVVTMSSPWAAFPASLAGQAGVVAAPEQLDNPDGTRQPIGTGPFEFVSWTPDKELIVERNPDYWRTDENGTQLPYLDRIEFLPIPDSGQRVNAMETDGLDMTWTVESSAVIKLRELARSGELQLVEQPGQTEVAFILLNLAAPPFDNPTARRAVALATDSQAWVDVIGQGIAQRAQTLFRPGTNWYADIPIASYDLAAAQQEVEAYEAENGPLAFSIQVVSTPLGRQQGDFLKAMWEAAGMEVEVKQLEGTTFLLDAVLGDYQSAVWAQFGSPDPDYEQVWWRSTSSAPIGSLSLNFPRHNDPATDAALDVARSTDDFDARKEAYDEVQRRFVEDLPYIYLSYVQPVVVATNEVRGITNGPLPDGQPAVALGGPGSFSYVTFLTQTWLTG
jgi:peptide/nickel transport system substrate-binding protein